MVHWDTVKCQHNPACVQMPILMGPVDQVSSTFQARLRLQGGHRQGVLAPTMRRMIQGPHEQLRAGVLSTGRRAGDHPAV